jgi:hypothetical protein
VAGELRQALNATLSEATGLVTVDCRTLEDAGPGPALVFEFAGGGEEEEEEEQAAAENDGGGTVRVPYKNFVIDARGPDGEGGLGCVLAVGELVGVVGEDVSPILGGKFFFILYFFFGGRGLHLWPGRTQQSCSSRGIVVLTPQFLQLDS